MPNLSKKEFVAFASGARLNDLMRYANTTEDAIILTDHKGCIEFTNSAWTELCQHPLESIKGRTCAILHGPLTDGTTITAANLLLRANQMVDMRVLNYIQDGSVFMNHVTIVPVASATCPAKVTHFVGHLQPIPFTPSLPVANDQSQEATMAMGMETLHSFACMQHGTMTENSEPSAICPSNSPAGSMKSARLHTTDVIALPSVDREFYPLARTHFESSATAVELQEQLTDYLDKSLIEYEICARFKFRCAAFRSETCASSSFVVRLFSDPGRSTIVVEFQRRAGCAFLFGSIYREFRAFHTKTPMNRASGILRPPAVKLVESACTSPDWQSLSRWMRHDPLEALQAVGVLVKQGVRVPRDFLATISHSLAETFRIDSGAEASKIAKALGQLAPELRAHQSFEQVKAQLACFNAEGLASIPNANRLIREAPALLRLPITIP